MTPEECLPASANIVYAPQWILNTIQVQQGLDKVCIHSIKDIHKRNNALKV
jgi:hypothetical protein